MAIATFGVWPSLPGRQLRRCKCCENHTSCQYAYCVPSFLITQHTIACLDISVLFVVLGAYAYYECDLYKHYEVYGATLLGVTAVLNKNGYQERGGKLLHTAK